MKRNYLVGYKVFFGLLGFSAIVTEIAAIAVRGRWNPGNFFSFFTIESNILAVVSLLIGAFLIYAKKKSKKADYFRGAVTLYMVITGIIFSVLLSGIEGISLTAVPWDNVVLHYIIPVAIALDWIADRSVYISFKKALPWLAFPILYLVYSLLRGPIVGWYPYPFLNPANGGYGTVFVTSVIIAIVGVVLVYVVTRFSGKTKTSKK
ncbi:MAG TPA: Pr6Pr family membrane protein [Candidatus Microsaccharimonas sp.]|jgi:hypothetical protein